MVIIYSAKLVFIKYADCRFSKKYPPKTYSKSVANFYLQKKWKTLPPAPPTIMHTNSLSARTGFWMILFAPSCVKKLNVSLTWRGGCASENVIIIKLTKEEMRRIFLSGRHFHLYLVLFLS